MDLLTISREIRDLIKEKQDKYSLTFDEDTHTYTMRDVNGVLRSDYPSVSSVYSQFYEPFNDLEKSLEMVNGDLIEQDSLLKKWRESGNISTNTGSRTHYELEKYLLSLYGNYKTVRQPIFECDENQTRVSNEMISYGVDYINLMIKRGAVLLDTEMVLGSPTLKYVGQPDKAWLMVNNLNELGIVITDWKTNKKKNFIVQPYTKQMLPPFDNLPDTSLHHYKIQLPAYGRLLLDMLKDTKYSNIKLFGCVIVHLEEGVGFVEYKVERDVINTFFGLENPLFRIDEVFKYKKNMQLLEEGRVNKLKNLY